MVFFVAYTVFEVPSNYLLKKYKPSRWFAFLMLVWGAMTMLIAATRNYGGLIATRFLLGAFEAGLFPGLVYCLTFWYKPNERALRVGIILAGATLGGAFGSAIAFGIGTIDGAHGLEGWRWLFLIEGVASCLFVPFIFFLYPDYPETVSWLSPEERKLAIERIKGVASLGHEAITWKDAWDTLVDWRLYLHHLVWIAYSVGFSSISLFAPTIVQGLGFEGLRAQLFTVPPYAIAFCIVTTVAWIADRYEMRSWCMAASFAICGVAFLIEGPRSPQNSHLPRRSELILTAWCMHVYRITSSHRVHSPLRGPVHRGPLRILHLRAHAQLAHREPPGDRSVDARRPAKRLRRDVWTDHWYVRPPIWRSTPLRSNAAWRVPETTASRTRALSAVLFSSPFLPVFLPTKSSRAHTLHLTITDDAVLRRDIHLQVVGVAGLSHRSLYERRVYVLRGPPRAGVTVRLHATQPRARAGRAEMEAVDRSCDADCSLAAGGDASN